ncbi:MAG: MarR family transcriptional regulator [Firmicutes bacterium]|nr:MarR family transcriptional regulator [Bacillota bacterium]
MNSDNTIHLIGRIKEEANKLIKKELKELGIDNLAPSHGDILAVLFNYEELTKTEIAEKINRDRSTVTTLVNKLLKLRLVDSKENPEDRRSNKIYLTKKGKELKTGFTKISEKLYKIQYKDITEEEREVFRRVLKKMHKNF